MLALAIVSFILAVAEVLVGVQKHEGEVTRAGVRAGGGLEEPWSPWKVAL